MTALLRGATLKGQDLELNWSDGQPSLALSLFWLRDHCQSPQSHHPETRQRLHDTFNIPADIAAHAVGLEDNGRVLRIDWAGEGHVSRFEASFLAALRRDPDILPIRRRTWDRDIIARSTPQVPYEDFLKDDAALKDYLEKV